MSEALYIEMPARKKGSPRPLWLRLIPLWALLLLLAVGVLLACAKDTPEARVHLANRRRAPRRRMISVLAAGEQS